MALCEISTMLDYFCFLALQAILLLELENADYHGFFWMAHIGFHNAGLLVFQDFQADIS